MKLAGFRAIPAILFVLALFPASLSAISVFDVIRLSEQKYSDKEIVRIIQATDSRFVLTAEDSARLSKAGVTEVVIREMLSRPAKPSAKAPRPRAAVKDSRKEAPADVPASPPEPASILDEIVRLTKAGLSEETVLAYAKAHRGDLPSVVSSDRLIWLRKSGVSESVVRYLTAIDVRASGEDAEEDIAYEPGEGESRSAAAGSYPADDNGGGLSDSGYGAGADYDTGYSGGGYYAGYPASDYASYYGDYPYYGYGGVFYAYPAYFFVNRGDFFGRFHHRRGHDFRGHDFRGHRRDAGHRRGFDRRDFPRDRQTINGAGRGSGGRRGSMLPGQGWRTPPALARGNFAQRSPQPRGPVMRSGGPGRSVVPPRGFGQVSRAPLGQGSRVPRGPVAGPGAPGRGTFSGGIGPAAPVARAPISRSGGAPSAGSPGVRGRR